MAEDDAMRIEPEISGVGIVLLGAFNPMILTPAWFAMHGILPKAAAENATLKSANPQEVEFSTALAARSSKRTKPSAAPLRTRSNLRARTTLVRADGPVVPTARTTTPS